MKYLTATILPGFIAKDVSNMFDLWFDALALQRRGETINLGINGSFVLDFFENRIPLTKIGHFLGIIGTLVEASHS
jgi:hypothetical protein